MKAEERDNLLIRLDERSESVFRELQSLNEHQVEQNGYIKEALERTARNYTWIKSFRLALTIGTPIAVLLITKGLQYW